MSPLALLLPIFAADAPVAPAVDVDAFRVVLNGSADVVPESSTFGATTSTFGSGFAPDGATGLRGGGGVGATFYPWTPLFDDDSPRALQPFLQRTSNVAVGAGASYSSVTYSAPAQGGTYTQASIPASVSTRFFFSPALALLAGGGFDYVHDVRAPAVTPGFTRDLWQPFGSIGIEKREGDSSLTLQWEATGGSSKRASRRSRRPPRCSGRASPSARARCSIAASILSFAAGLIRDGGTVRAAFAAYPTRDLGLSLFAEYASGEIYIDQALDYSRLEGGPGVSYWLSRVVQLSVAYTPQWSAPSLGSDTSWSHDVGVGVTVRLPDR